jgi:hypothetical protein
MSGDFGCLAVQDMKRVFDSGERIAESNFRLMSQQYIPQELYQWQLGFEF